MLPVVVVPMLNEEACIAATCRSLGFGVGASKSETVLVLVDNGSTDGTMAIAEGIRAASGLDRVVVVQEDERGYVPARAAGIRAIVAHMDRIGSPADRTLVLQADADTIYEPGYVDAMLAAARAHGRGHLFEGVSIPPRPEGDPCRLLRELESAIDDDAPRVPFELDVVVDDKVVAYFLADYEAWGGHRRECRSEHPHDELHLETTRLYIRARTGSGTKRFLVDEAMATTSPRRILENPALAFATAGVPREASWVRRWNEAYRGPRSLESFRVDNSPVLGEAIAIRRRHLAAIFRFLPEIVEREAEKRRQAAMPTDKDAPSVWNEYGHPHPLLPGRMLEDAFERAGVD